MIQQTSLNAYYNLRPVIETKREIVFKALQDLHFATNEEIASYLRWSINRITPRIKELRDLGRVKLIGYKETINNEFKPQRKAMIWGIK